MTGTLVTDARCHGCGTPLKPYVRKAQPRKWCSERCRRDTMYGGTCEICGARTSGSNGPGTAASVCLDCLTWTREAILDALHRWNEEHGTPPTVSDWRSPGEGFPTAITVAKRFGSWNAALLAAGYGLRCDRRPETQAEIERLVAEGHTLAEVAARFGVSGEAISRRLRYRGLTARGLREGRRAA